MNKNKLKEFNLSLSELQTEQFRKYQEFLFEYNSHTNLVSSAEPDVVALKHFTDSLSIALLVEKLDLNSEKIILDVGIGGGFPGVPIIIAFPSLKLCAVDSVGKKTEFIRQLCEKLEISDRVEIINSRAEELNKQNLFDIGVSRAVDRLNVLLEYTLPYLKVGGYFVVYKAKTFQEEISEAKNALNVLGGEIVDVVHYTLSDEERNLILVKKVKATPDKYPRKTGIPHKKPL